MKQIHFKQQDIRIIRKALYSGIFVFLLMGLLAPFHLDMIGDLPIRFLYYACISIASVIVGILSGIMVTYGLKKPLAPSLPLNTVHRNAIILQIFNAPILAAVLTTINGYMFCDHGMDIWWYDGHLQLSPYFHFLYYVAAIDVLFFIGTYIRNRNWHLRYQLVEVRTINALLEKKAEVYEKENLLGENEKGNPLTKGDSEIETAKQENAPEKISSKEHKTICGQEFLSSNILYVEAMANYADIWYLDQDTPTHKILRITLKQIKGELDDIPYMAQCHRAFIVNLNFVVTMTNRNNGYQLQLFGINKQIPVSRTYTPLIKEKLQG